MKALAISDSRVWFRAQISWLRAVLKLLRSSRSDWENSIKGI